MGVDVTTSTYKRSQEFKAGRAAILSATTEAYVGDLFVTQGSVCRKDEQGDWYSLDTGITYDYTELARACALTVWAIL